MRLVARLAVVAFCWMTTLYALVASSTFAYLQFLRPRVFPWTGVFADWHATMAWLWLPLLLVALGRDLVRPWSGRPLARLLAASPADGTRDAARAMVIVEELLKTEKSTALGETMAMAFAEMGQFDQAVAVQRDIMAAASKAGLTAAVRAMAENLRRYERGQPCRTPWPDADPIHTPGPPVTPGLDAALGTAG